MPINFLNPYTSEYTLESFLNVVLKRTTAVRELIPHSLYIDQDKTAGHALTYNSNGAYAL
jgi:hypothetical protein